jgi:hypothetical protein
LADKSARAISCRSTPESSVQRWICAMRKSGHRRRCRWPYVRYRIHAILLVFHALPADLRICEIDYIASQQIGRAERIPSVRPVVQRRRLRWLPRLGDARIAAGESAEGPLRPFSQVHDRDAHAGPPRHPSANALAAEDPGRRASLRRLVSVFVIPGREQSSRTRNPEPSTAGAKATSRNDGMGASTPASSSRRAARGARASAPARGRPPAPHWRGSATARTG